MTNQDIIEIIYKEPEIVIVTDTPSGTVEIINALKGVKGDGRIYISDKGVSYEV